VRDQIVRTTTFATAATGASRRAGIPTVAAHRPRHRAACRVLADGGNLTEVAQLLCHEAEATAAIYAKVDLAALSAAARPWPQAEGGRYATRVGV
jgi:integrase/recombinase XerD